jgi:hypothetical protein
MSTVGIRSALDGEAVHLDDLAEAPDDLIRGRSSRLAQAPAQGIWKQAFQLEKRRQNERALGESRMRESQSRVLDDQRRLPEQQVDVQRPGAERDQAVRPWRSSTL